MSASSTSSNGTEVSYDSRMASEKSHFDREYQSHGTDEILVQRIPPVWQFLEQRVEAMIRAETGGLFLQDCVAQVMDARPAPRMISLASGPCGLEMDIAGRLRGDYELVCVDINADLLGRGIEQARRKGLRLTGRAADCNSLQLEEGQYDVVMAFASLHHFTDFERLFPAIVRALRPGGVFVTMDIPSRNGYRMWDETWAVIRTIWSLLPDRLKVNHTRFQHPTPTPEYDNVSYGDQTFECVRSQDILDQLALHFEPLHYLSYYALCRRLFDPMYGPNYDLSRSFDRAVLEWVWELDQAALAEGRLAPETFFGVFRPLGAAPDPRTEAPRMRMRRDTAAIRRCVAALDAANRPVNWTQRIRHCLTAGLAAPRQAGQP